MARDEEIIEFASAAELQDWLSRNYSASRGFWLKLMNNAAGEDVLTYAQALDVALCYGWIDGQKGKLDDAHWLQRFTPRSARSRWSKVNREKVAALIEQGRMQPPGIAEVERAKRDGRWEAAYAGAKSATVPDDLARALEANPAAAEFFKTLDSQNRYSILYRVQDAKKPETRARRIEKYVGMLANHEKIHT
ncbi:YdeI family protein [Streptomyces sp. NPDC058451]|uniref:YdeI/OmpD-associated family protein n=1 Tax=unclassified Streptomyces TaxID=2593676 RepID=UPI003657F7D4